jgi:hypothetical protein
METSASGLLGEAGLTRTILFPPSPGCLMRGVVQDNPLKIWKRKSYPDSVPGGFLRRSNRPPVGAVPEG